MSYSDDYDSSVSVLNDDIVIRVRLELGIS